MAANHTVASQWKQNKISSSYNGNLRSDGTMLYSYKLMIGYTDMTGKKIAIDYTASSGYFCSQTTSKHVGLAKANADRVYSPKDVSEVIKGE